MPPWPVLQLPPMKNNNKTTKNNKQKTTKNNKTKPLKTTKQNKTQKNFFYGYHG
jgi:hypothetical protein